MLDNKLGFNNRSCFNGRTSVNKCVVYSAFRAMFAKPKHHETELFAYLSGKHTFPYLLNSFLYVLTDKSILFIFGLSQNYNNTPYEFRANFHVIELLFSNKEDTVYLSNKIQICLK